MPLKRSTASAAALMPLLAGCVGVTTPPTSITSSSATLTAEVTCSADAPENPCLGWFQWWEDSSTPTVQSSQSTPIGPVSSPVSKYTITHTPSGLKPGGLYHYQVCGSGDTNIPASRPLCTGPFTSQVNAPGTTPADLGDFDAFQTFRTATSTTAGTTDLGRILTTADTPTNRISRDGGVSAAYAPGKALWVFGDTGLNGGVFPNSVTGTAALGSFTPGKAPRALTEVPTPPAPPRTDLTSSQPFFPSPSGLKRPGNPPVPCSPGGVPVAWIGGAAAVPGTQRVLLTYAEMCLVKDVGWFAERLVLTVYEPASNKFTARHVPFDVSAAAEDLPLGQGVSSPVFGDDGYLYLFDHTRDGDSGVFVTRVPSSDPGRWGDASNYQWWAQPPGGQPAGWYGWTEANGHLKSVLPAGVLPWGLAVNDYSATTSKGLAMIVQTGFGSAPFTVYTADSPTGPWTAAVSAKVPDTCTGGGWGCYALIGHPELSDNDQLVFSWLSPGDRGSESHLRLAAVPWQR
ncbi:hypothetical protein E1200_12780 [Actinomadura sp. GC306]|uniref:hypothetical protein n=1 Tax=Actinomadura sp. GC306 TaxID=2530367 RepID=UPI00104F9772|nr:hypothetical protein [Actinomadura sp. GC306]TDC68081.1 hypothetical protein E1200_12780 [Actinomadura sp. GC306]